MIANVRARAIPVAWKITASHEKDYKRGQWRWQHTKMLDPERAERWWLALSVSTLWVGGVNCQAEITLAVARRSSNAKMAPKFSSCGRPAC